MLETHCYGVISPFLLSLKDWRTKALRLIAVISALPACIFRTVNFPFIWRLSYLFKITLSQLLPLLFFPITSKGCFNNTCHYLIAAHKHCCSFGGCYDSIKALIYNKLLRMKVEPFIRKTFNLIAYAGLS